MTLINAFLRNQHGTTAIQYALVAGILSVAVLVGSLMMRDELVNLYEGVGEQANEALASKPEN